MKRRMVRTISIRTEESVTIRRSGAGAVCQQCAVAAMVTPEDAAAVTKLFVRSIYQMIEAGQLHFQETAGGVLVCLESLRKNTLLLEENVGRQTNSKEKKS